MRRLVSWFSRNLFSEGFIYVLCPNCGTEVGDQLGLCSRCAASGTSTSLGAIKPALKVVRLKPGQTAEDYNNSQATESFSRKETLASYTPQREPARGKGVLVTALILIFGALLSLAYLLAFQSGGIAKFELKSEPEAKPGDFSHIVIHEKKEIIVDGRSIYGVYRIDDREMPLGKPKAFFNHSKNTLEIHFPGADKGREAKFIPLAKVWLQFGKLGNKIERDKLQSYMLEFNSEHEPQRIVRTYSRHLAEFAEVSLLSNGLKTGDNIRGSLQSAQTVDRGPTNSEVSWQLTFDIPLETSEK